MKILKFATSFSLNIVGELALNQFYIGDFSFLQVEKGSRVMAKFTMKRNPSFLMMNAYLPSFFTMAMTIASLFLDDHMHFTTSIMLVLTSQLCLYTIHIVSEQSGGNP